MEAYIKELEEKLFVEKTVNAESTKFLKSKQDSLRSQLEEWETKYDEDVESLTVTYNKLVAEREANLEVLVKLKKRREEELAEEQAKVAAEEATKEEARRAEILKQKQDAAATQINATMRIFLKRKKEQAASKGGKKGGKKGKKGKKKWKWYKQFL